MNSTNGRSNDRQKNKFPNLHDMKERTNVNKEEVHKTMTLQSGTGEAAINFTLDTNSAAPIYRQIIQQIEYAILSGRMKPGDRLPTIRSLAVDLKTNPNTIAKAYNELEIRGVLATQVGSGTYISDKKPVVEDDSLNRKIHEVLGRFMQEMRDLGVDKRELVKLVEEQVAGSR